MPAELSHPFVSVIMPVRNEAAYIECSLGSMLTQDYPSDRYEVLVVDGVSTDSTIDMVADLAKASAVDVRVLQNPARIVPAAMNIGIRAAKGEVILRMDGHTQAPYDYISKCVTTLQATGAVNVGGVVEYVGSDAFSRACGLAAQSKFGCGGAPARSAQEGAVDTVSFGCWRRETFEKFGLFDEFFVRTQDSEFNYRTRLLGGTVWMNPTIRTRYFNRASMSKLAKQYWQYGFWKTRLMFKLQWLTKTFGVRCVSAAFTPGASRPTLSKRGPACQPWKGRHYGSPDASLGKAGATSAGAASAGAAFSTAVGRLHWRHFVPPLFVLGMVLSFFVLGCHVLVRPLPFGWGIGFAIPIMYVLADLAASVTTAAQHRAWRLLPLFLVIFPVLHVCWGAGFLWGLLNRPVPERYAEFPGENLNLEN